MGTIFITSKDLNRLRTLLRDAMEKNQESKKNLRLLNDELNQSEVCEQKDIPKDVITMNSRIRLRDLDSNEGLIYTLVYPAHANAELGRISVLAPIGTAVIGNRVGDVIEWPVPGGVRRLQVKEVLFQPEAAGDFLS